MTEPMLVRLSGCVVFAGLMAAMLTTTVLPHKSNVSDAVAKAAIHERLQQVAFTRP